ncbi:hypothetical protein PENTCL1PPCAC_22689, partial [Pristionchus entomophagus]
DDNSAIERQRSKCPRIGCGREVPSNHFTLNELSSIDPTGVHMIIMNPIMEEIIEITRRAHPIPLQSL